jgi:hypothetical protein
MMHSGGGNPNGHPSGRTFHVLKPVSPRDWMKGYTEHVLNFDHEKLDKFFPDRLASEAGIWSLISDYSISTIYEMHSLVLVSKLFYDTFKSKSGRF